MLIQNKHHKKFKKSERGMAFIEAIPVLFMVVVVFNFSLGFFGAIHSGILNSIASYNYTMETFRFRTNLIYFRPGDLKMAHYMKDNKPMSRVHGVTSDGIQQNDGGAANRWPATVRSIAFNKSVTKLETLKNPDGVSRQYSLMAKNDPTNIWGIRSDYSPDSKEASAKSPEIWIKTVYGICLTADCN